LTDERFYDAQPERVFAALIHALAGLSARVERVEGFGTAVTFRTSGGKGGDLLRFWAQVLPGAAGSVVRIQPLDGTAAGTPVLPDLELTPGLLDAVQDRLERGPQARP
jgi:hypothetical protein